MFAIDACEPRRLLSTVLNADGSVYGNMLTTPAIKAVEAPSGGGAEVAGFQIEIAFAGGLTAAQQAAFSNAAARWQSVITGDIPDIGASPSQWGAAVDDIRITAQGQAIDGVGGILGQAGPQFIRLPSNLPISGEMTFDTADLANMQANGTLGDVILHEMGHVLGLGTIWSLDGLITGAGTSNPVYTGTNGVAEFRRMAGNLALTSVPVENTGGAGTADGHWRETTFGNELMTGFIAGASNPLSRLTAAQFIDLGYPLVNVDAADLYTTTNPLPTVGTLSPNVGSSATGVPITLSLSSAADNGSVASVSFYRETNGIAGLQAGTTSTVTADTLVGSDTTSPYSATVATTGLASGTYTYYARAADNFGALSAVATTTHIIASAVSPPSTPDLAASSDLGVSSVDNITADNTPTFLGTATAFATVNLLVDNAVVASGAADFAGNWSITAPGIANGTHSVTATATVAAVTSAPSAALSVVIDTVAPTLTSTFIRSPAQAIDATFSEPISSPGTPGPFTLTNTTTGQSFINTTFAGIQPSGAYRYNVSPANSLSDGVYTGIFNTGGATDVAGNAVVASSPTITFRFLRADFNGDFTVNFDDLLIIAQNYGASSAINASGDANYDGVVDFSDLLITAQTYGTSLSASATNTTEISTRKTRVANDVL